MPRVEEATFETPVGNVTIRWSERGIVSIAFAAGGAESVRGSPAGAGRRPAVSARAAPPHVTDAARLVTQHLQGTPQNLSAVRLDLTPLSDARRRVYEVLRQTPPGLPVPIVELADRAGLADPRAVLRAVVSNPFPVVVPGHRVLTRRGDPAGGLLLDLRRRILAAEAAHGLAALRAGEKTEAPAERRFLYDPAAAERALRRSDPKLAAIVDRVGAFALAIRHADSPFEALARSVVYQQLAGSAAAAIFARVKALGASGFPAPDELLRIPSRRLRDAGLSASKLLSLCDLAKKTVEGVVPALDSMRGMSDEELLERLTSIRGIGRWTVEIFLIFRLGRPDVLPADDYGIRKGLAFALGSRSLASPKQLLAYGERWRPYRSFASWYLWRAADMAKNVAKSK